MASLLCPLACGDDGGSGDGMDSGPGASSVATQADSGGTSVADDGTATSGDSGADTLDGGSSDEGPTPPPPPGIECEEPFTYQGLDGCVATVEGIQIKFFPLAEGEPVEHLAVYFHGDTAPGWYDNWAFPAVVDWALPNNVLTLGVLSPVIGDSGAPEWGESQPPDAEAVATAIEAFADAYGAPREEIFYWSTSGGSWFFTSSYVPVAGHRLPGWFAINCGGSGFSYPFSWDTGDASLRDRISLFFNYGTEDFLAEPTAASFEEYGGLGFEVDQLVHEGATHCAHPIDEPTLDFWSQFL